MQFESLVNRITPTLRRIVYKLNWQANFFNEDDLYQEAILQLWLDYQQGKLADKTDSYILQGCYFHLKNYLRKNCDKANLTSLENSINLEGGVIGLCNILPREEPDSLFESVNCKLIIERINNNGLTKREKEVFCLALEGLTVREIALKLGISHVRVVKLKARLKDKCRKYIDTI